MDTGKRTILKAILWNALGLLTMSLVGLAMTGSAAVGGAMAVMNTLIGLTCYVAYERVWARIGWGRTGGHSHG
ncbi:DUF2061 domain-containing protein [Defluviimonas sp. D31]|uniref:DUF2061 domain-containing protein n=1 Tax=Defluviimonas sp. D31 TaxID=3083253 RepID=UPI00296F4759|nr:DUF2061 domain-containing protein [Defluviimonas sp. D31]MDW4550366.1 DUF2061 domain-containing protein [Defluviimonas sp. D31]